MGRPRGSAGAEAAGGGGGEPSPSMGRRGAEGPRPAGGSPRRHSSWPAALLAASVLCSCFLITQAEDIPVTLVPEKPHNGDTVTLTPGGQPDYVTCGWYRGEESETNWIFTQIPSISQQHNGPSYTGRETIHSGCSLEIKDLNVNDSAIYTVWKVLMAGPEKGHVEIKVPAPPVSAPPFSPPPFSPPPVSPLVSPRRFFTVGVIVGIGIGALAGTVLLGVLVYYFVRRFKQGANQGVSISSASPPVSAD